MYSDSINSDLFFAWCKFWCCVWFGTTVGGSIFGFGIVLLSVLAYSPSPDNALGATVFGLFMGAIWAGVVGLFVIPSFALLMYVCFCNRKPYVLACVAGALTGTASLPPLFFVTGPIGALGAFYCARLFLDSPDSWLIREAEERRVANGQRPFNFTIGSLFGRTTAIAVLIALWTFVTRILFG